MTKKKTKKINAFPMLSIGWLLHGDGSVTIGTAGASFVNFKTKRDAFDFLTGVADEILTSPQSAKAGVENG